MWLPALLVWSCLNEICAYAISKNDVNSEPELSQKLPDAIIIGVKKGGTRALLEFLRLNPAVKAPGPEVHFFDRHFDRGWDWYRRQMPETREDQITIEKTPSYFVTKLAPQRVYKMNPRLKLIVVVRDPLTRAISDYTQTASKREGMPSFEQMAFDDATGAVNTSWGAVKIGLYFRHTKRWLKYFPLSQLHFVNGEKLISDPATVLQSVEDFLEIPRTISSSNFVFDSVKKFPCLIRTEGTKPHCLGKTKGRTHPDLRPDVLERLSDFYKPHNQIFYDMVGENFGW